MNEELREVVARRVAAIDGQYSLADEPWTWDDYGPVFQDRFTEMAASAIAAATPLIEAALIERLALETEKDTNMERQNVEQWSAQAWRATHERAVDIVARMMTEYPYMATDDHDHLVMVAQYTLRHQDDEALTETETA